MPRRPRLTWRRRTARAAATVTGALALVAAVAAGSVGFVERTHAGQAIGQRLLAEVDP